MRTAQTARRLGRRDRPDPELNIIPMIDIFTVLVTFLLMTAVFSRIVVLNLGLPVASATQQLEQLQDLKLEVIVREASIEVADQGTGRLADFPKNGAAHDLKGLSEYLQRVKARFPDKTQATILLQADTSYDTLVQVMDTLRLVTLARPDGNINAELFPDISIGDAPT
jgi:biopolymer transport protein ExbD